MENINQSTPFADKIKFITSQIEDIRTKAARIADSQNKPQLAKEIRDGFMPSWNKTDPNALQMSNTKVAIPIIEADKFDYGVNGLRAISGVSSKTNNLAIPQEAPATLTTPGYFTDLNGMATDFQSVYEKMQKLGENQPTFSREQYLKNQYKEWGIDESFSLLKGIASQSLSVRSELEKLNEKEKLDLANIEKRPGIDMQFLEGEKNRISNEAAKAKAPLAAQLAGLATQSEMLQGNVQLAKSYANDLVDAATYDAESKANSLKQIGTYYKDVLDSMGDRFKLVYNNAVNKAEREYDQQKSERSQIVKWATDFDTAPALYHQNLATISFEDASKLVSNYMTLYAVKGGEDLLSVEEAKKLRVPYGTTKGEAANLGIIPSVTEGSDSSAFWNSINKGVNELQQGEDWGNVWQRIKMQFPSVSDGKIDQALGTSWREGGAYEAYKSKKGGDVSAILDAALASAAARQQAENNSN